MDGIRVLLARFSSLFHRRRLDRELEEELRSHLDFAIADHRARGLSDAAARTAALRTFGGVAQIKEGYRRQRGLPMFEILSRDFQYALRQLWKAPGFTITTVLTLAIGIGVNTAVFSIMDAIVLRPLALPDLDRVVTVAEEQGRGDYKQVAMANYQSWLQQSNSFEDLAIRSNATLSLSDAGEVQSVTAGYTSANFFSVLRATPLLGRVYDASECVPGKDNVAVLSFAFWNKHFGADASVVGRTIRMEDHVYSIVGVMQKSMQYPSTADVFLPLAPTAPQAANRTFHSYLVVGRLRAGVTVQQAQSEMRVIAERLASAYPASNQGWSAKVEPLLDKINGDYTPMYIRLVLAATGFVLLVVCANVANLQFVRGIARRPEIAVRTALGAGRNRLLGHLMMENIVLGLLGAVGGLMFAAISLHLCAISMPDRVARYVAGWSNISLNGRALAFSFAIAVGAGFVSGLLPALKALRINLVDQLKAGSRTTSGSRQTHRLRDMFAISQIAFSVLLVIGAALMCKGMWSMLHVANVYQPDQSLTFAVTLPESRYNSDEKMAAWYQTSLERLRGLPGVTHAEVTTALPRGEDSWSDNVGIENRPAVPGKFQSAAHLVVSAGYFQALHIPLVSGRVFNNSDTLRSQPVAIVSHRFAERYFPGDNPIGHRIRMGSAPDEKAVWMRIVGVVSDVNYEWVDREDAPAVYMNVAQLPPAYVNYLLTTTGKPLLLASSVHAALAGIDSRIALNAMQTYQQYLNESLTGLLYVAVMLTVDAGIGLLLAAIGIFGVMANTVAERSREIALRMVMGANPQDMLRMILQRAAILTGAGVVSGIVLATALARVSASLLFGVSPNDPTVFLSITAAITAIALLVSWGPARRAASIDPMRAIRTE